MNNLNKIDEINNSIECLINEAKAQAKEINVELSSNINDNINKLRIKLDNIPLIDQLNRSKIVYSISNLNNVLVAYGQNQDTFLVKKIVDLWNNLNQIKKLIGDKNNIIIKCLTNVIDNELLQNIAIDISDENNLKIKRVNKSPDELYSNYIKAKNSLKQSISNKKVYAISEKLLDELFFSYTKVDINLDKNKEKLTRS